MNSQTTVDIKKPLLWLAWGSALLGGIPLWVHLQRPVQVLLPLALLAGIWAERRGRVLLGGYWGTLLVLLVFLFYALQIRITYLVAPVMNMLALMLAVRLAGEKSPRNLLQLYMLSIFALAASTLISLDMSFIVFLLLIIFSVTVSLVLLAFYTQDQNLTVNPVQLKVVLKWSLVLPAVSLVLMLFFFLILPRTQSPLLHFLNPGGQASTGFSESVAPGSVAGNSASQEVAFRAEGPELDPTELYWRGIVLNQFEDGVWQRRHAPEEQLGTLEGRRTIELRILPEGWRQRYLVTLDKPLSVERRRIRRGDDLVFTFRWPPKHRFEYRMTAQLSELLPSQGPRIFDRYLQVPEQVDPRVQELALQIKSAGETEIIRIDALKDFFREQPLAYSTENLPVTDNAVAVFLFESRTGYCEHFASSFALLLRLAGVPARLVGGYYGGVYNELGGYTLVTESMAHVWVEAFLPGQGWLRIDPSQYATNVATSLRNFSRHQLPAWQGVVDSMQHFWSRAVLNFYLEQQVETVQSMRRNVRSLRQQASWQDIVMTLAGVGLAATLFWFWRRPRLTRQEQLIQLVREKAAHFHGDEWGASALGLEELAKGTKDPVVAEFARRYQEIVFRGRALSTADYQYLRQLIGRIGKVRK